MKFTLLGFNQKKAIDYGLDVNDLIILRWFVDFYHCGGMVKKTIDGKEFAWSNYSKIIEDLPILSMKKDALYRRFKKFCDIGIMEHTTVKQGGTYSFYRLTGKYEILLNDDSSDLKPNGTDLKPNGTDEKPDRYGSKTVGVRMKNRRGTDEKPEQNINLLNNKSIKDKSIKDSKEKINKKESRTYDDILQTVDNLELQDALREFINMRKLIKKPLTNNALELAIKKLDKLATDDGDKIKIVNNSVMNSWQGFYPLKEEEQQKNDYSNFDFSCFDVKG